VEDWRKSFLKMRIYFDHNAGAPLRSSARQAMTEFLSANAEGNPASVHFSGQRARRLLEQARVEVAALIDAPPSSIVFTSGGTESNNLAILGAVQASPDRRRIVTSTIEHSSILSPALELERRGFDVVRMPVDHAGILLRMCPDPIDQHTALVSLGLANAEVGTVQELRDVAEQARRMGAIFHLDAAQAIGRIPVAVETSGCDLLTMSAHKLGGPAGIGALYVRPGCPLVAQLWGGPQETGLRAGTPNLCGAVGFGAAARETLAQMKQERERIAGFARSLLHYLDAIPGLRLNGPSEGRIENTLNLTFPGVSGESLLMALDLEGVEISMGSACAAGAVEPSHVLIAMGRTAAEARSSVRFSLGWSTSAEEIELAAEIVPRVWRRVAAAEPMAAELRP
jgi:cysteine desulfurase